MKKLDLINHPAVIVFLGYFLMIIILGFISNYYEAKRDCYRAAQAAKLDPRICHNENRIQIKFEKEKQ